MQMSYEDALDALKRFASNGAKLKPQWTLALANEAENLVKHLSSFDIGQHLVMVLLDIIHEAKKDVKNGEKNKFAPNNTARRYMLNTAGVKAFRAGVANLPDRAGNRNDNNAPRVADVFADDGGMDLTSNPTTPEDWQVDGRPAPRGELSPRGVVFGSYNASAEDTEEDRMPQPAAHPVVPAQVLLAGTVHPNQAVVKTDIRFEPPTGHAAPVGAIPLVNRFRDKVYDVATRVCNDHSGDPRMCNGGNSSYELFFQGPVGHLVTPADVRKLVLARWGVHLSAYTPTIPPTVAQRQHSYFYLHLTIAVNGETEIYVIRMNMF